MLVRFEPSDTSAIHNNTFGRKNQGGKRKKSANCCREFPAAKSFRIIPDSPHMAEFLPAHGRRLKKKLERSPPSPLLQCGAECAIIFFVRWCGGTAYASDSKSDGETLGVQIPSPAHKRESSITDGSSFVVSMPFAAGWGLQL